MSVRVIVQKQFRVQLCFIAVSMNRVTRQHSRGHVRFAYLTILNFGEVRNALDVNEDPLQGPVVIHACPCVASNHPELLGLLGVL